MQFSFEYAQPSSSEEAMWRLTRDLPEGEAALAALAQRSLAQLNAAVVRGADEGPIAGLAELCEKLGIIATRLGLDDDEFDAQFRAPALKVPLWGQRGDFVLSAKGCRSWAHFDGVLTSGLQRLELRPVDYDRRWLTPFGGGWYGRLRHPTGPLVKSVRAAIAEIRGKGPLFRIPDEAPSIEDYADDEAADYHNDYWVMKAAWGEDGWLREWLAANPPA